MGRPKTGRVQISVWINGRTRRRLERIAKLLRDKECHQRLKEQTLEKRKPRKRRRPITLRSRIELGKAIDYVVQKQWPHDDAVEEVMKWDGFSPDEPWKWEQEYKRRAENAR